MKAAPASRGYGPLPLVPGLYPGRVWPANILRLHVVFPRPMACGAVEQPLRLFDPEGREREGVFVDLDFGLWSACGRILTVLLHPGRVKRGLAARERLGPALTAGEALTLVLAPALRASDGSGHGLPGHFPLRISPPVFDPIPPSAIRRTGNGLRLGGPAPIDALGALAHARLIAPDGRTLRPRLVPHPGGVLHLVPRDGPCPQLRTAVGPALEDCCGNRRGTAFEVIAPPLPQTLPPDTAGAIRPC